MEFLPWSKKMLLDSLNQYLLSDQLCLIDVELGGACNFRCKYCDTPKYKHEIQYDLSYIEKLLLMGKIKWIFLCGLGEPTARKNLPLFKEILSFCEKNNMKCCAFSNIAEFDDEIFCYVEKEILYPMFKLDSFEVNTICKIYDISEEIAKKQIANVQKLSSYVKCKNNYTNICASIVPSTMNRHSINEVINWCYKHNIFPLIGDLEDAGKGQNEYSGMKLNDEVLKEINNYIFSIIGNSYRVPICPSVLFGVHITYDGWISVDEFSGLSCHWFWLTEPKVKKICNIKSKSFKELSDSIIDFRKERRKDVEKIVEQYKKMIFGGCGGDIVDLLSFYLKNM